MAILGYWGLYIALVFVGSFVLGMMMGGSALMFGEASGVIIGLLVLLFYVGLTAMFVWFLPTFAAAGPLTALRGKVHVLAARKVVKGRFWALFGSGLVAGLIGYVVYYVAFGMGAMVGLSSLFTPDLFEAFVTEDAGRISEILSQATGGPGFWVGVAVAIVLTAFGTAFYQMIITGPPAFFTRQWAEAGGLPMTDLPETGA